jgi:predicted ATPase
VGFDRRTLTALEDRVAVTSAMQCPECQTENPAGETVCLACGNVLGCQCPVCGAQNQSTTGNCAQCGHDLGAWRPALGPATAPLVDRDAEMAAIETALSRTMQGYGQVVGVLGVAGVGKGRLCREITNRCRLNGMPVFEVACTPHGRAVPFLPVRDLLAAMCALRPDDSVQTAAARVADSLQVLGADAERWIPITQSFLAVADLETPLPELDFEARQEMISEVTRALVLTRSEAEPVLLLIQEAQWLDPETNMLFAHIVEGMATKRLLLLLTFRPGYHASWTGKPYYHQLPVRPLAPDASDELVRRAIGNDPALSDCIELIVKRTRGYPHFIEEAIRLLTMNHLLAADAGGYRMARPVETHDIPPTLESTIAARIENLDEVERRVLYCASVIGGRIPTSVLKRIAEISERDLWRVLGELHQSAFLDAHGWSPAVGCTFVHPLTQEVAYHCQTPQRRARLHGVVATALEEEFASNLGEHAALIAHHWEAANDKFKADLWRRRAARGVKQIRVQRALRRSKKH